MAASIITVQEIIERVTSELEGVVPKASWGETSLFYNPGKALPNGVYFCTLKEKNGDNDKSSDLDRDGVFRISIGSSKPTFFKHFGPKPARPAKGQIIDTGHDFTQTGVLMPHPIYGWMSWVSILSPTVEQFEEIYPLIVEAHGLAVGKFDKRMRKTE